MTALSPLLPRPICLHCLLSLRLGLRFTLVPALAREFPATLGIKGRLPGLAFKAPLGSPRSAPAGWSGRCSVLHCPHSGPPAEGCSHSVPPLPSPCGLFPQLVLRSQLPLHSSGSCPPLPSQALKGPAPPEHTSQNLSLLCVKFHWKPLFSGL